MSQCPNFRCLHACLGLVDSSSAVMVCPHWPHYSDTSTENRYCRYCRYCRYPDQDPTPSSGNLTATQIHLLFMSHSATNIALICAGICIAQILLCIMLWHRTYLPSLPCGAYNEAAEVLYIRLKSA